MKFITHLCRILLATTILLPMSSHATKRIVNVYAWTGEVSEDIVRQFEQASGIHVNFSTYENNEVMYAKLRANPDAGYDVIMPSSYYVDRMRAQGMLLKLDRHKLANWKNLDASFLNLPFDPKSEYCMPFIWGSTGIYYDKKYFNHIEKWADYWQPRFHNQLMLLNDTREVFSIALITLGYSANDRNPAHIKQAYEKLRKLMPNVKVFSTETVISIMVDEDATAGMSWNGDAFKAKQENHDLKFVYPQDGYVIWVDSFAIPTHAHHQKEAYAFLNFMLQADIAKQTTIHTGFATANVPAKKLLPKKLSQDPIIYPSKQTLKRAQFQVDIGDSTMALLEKYWEELKMGA